MKEIFFVYSYRFLEGIAGARYYEIIGKPMVILKVGYTLTLQKEMCKLEIISIRAYERELKEIDPSIMCQLQLREVKEGGEDLRTTFTIYGE